MIHRASASSGVDPLLLFQVVLQNASFLLQLVKPFLQFFITHAVELIHELGGVCRLPQFAERGDFIVAEENAGSFPNDLDLP